MKKRLLILLPVIAFSLSSCVKDAVDYTGYTGLETVDPNSSYLPSKKGTYWKYISNYNGVEVSSTQTLDGTKSTFSGRDYLDFTASSPGQESQKGYYYMGNHEYRLRASTQGIVLDILYLVDNKKIGEEWTAAINDSGTILGVPGQVRGRIIEKDITKEVLGKKYTGVYHTEANIDYDAYGHGFESFGTYDYYIAKGIPLIEIDSDVEGIVSTTKLTSYLIK